ncbi:amino acid adenylation domain-containing protein [Hymenobacter sp. RP-2-7]|uniref:Amino acid adenylation domain-containing protein n=1 Tax=Hymenobacter polaris TaxID=2682546 RepID=A0A7Y0ACS4_9BACT|nr:non-ribosomal peptide synthetase [Hymenobacter polaris]NML64817.1 amino acid adenylation domain-containing protein [Hymenobacter polaris]
MTALSKTSPTVKTSTLLPAVEPAETAAFDPFAGPAISHLLPLTEAQAEIWVACQLGGNDANRAYNESVSLRLRGPLHRPALTRAVQTLADRHEALRLAFSADGRFSYVLAALALPLPCQDAQAAPDPEQAVADYLAQEAQHVFDLQRGPLVKVALLQLGPAEHHFVLTAHHLVCDGWSAGVLLRELGAAYSAYRHNRPLALPPPASFRQYADQQLALGQQVAYQRAEQYWLQEFADEVPLVNLPTDAPRPAARTYRAARADYPLPPALTTALKQVGLRAGCSFVTTLLVAFEAFLHQLTGQTDLVVGLPAAGQPGAEMPELVGHCVSLLPLRSCFRPELSFGDYLRQRKPAILDAYDHQQLTFGSLLKKLPLARDAARVPLVPVVFNLDLGMADGVQLEGLGYEYASNPRAYEAFELFVNASGSERALTLEWSYNTTLFQPATIARLMAEFTALLQRLVATPAASLRELTAGPAPALPPAYQALNATTHPYPATQTLGQLLTAQAAASPHATALEAGTQHLTYQQLHAQANRLAHYLRQRGVQPGHVVALAADRSADLLVALLACLQCGAPYVPLDPSYPAERLAFMLTDSEAQLVLASAPLALTGPVAAPVVLLAEAQQAAASLPTTAPEVVLDSASPLYMLYTSGSTGQPKGVVVSHRNAVNFLCSMQQAPGLAATDRLLAITTISFDIAGLELFLPLLSGATVVLAPTEAVRDGQRLLQLLSQKRITVLQATPTSWRLLLAAGWNAPLPLKALSGGEPLPPDLAAQLLARCQSVWNLYGPTETTIWSAVQRVRAGEPVTIGRPIANTQFYVLDEQQRLLPAGQVGELCIGGEGVAQGYWRRPALTAERFLPSPFIPPPNGRLYRTGDLGQLLPSGELQCLGRLDQQVKLRGHRIELGEIEHALLALPEVREAVVTLAPAAPGDERLAAYVVLALGHPAATEPPPLRTARWRAALLRQLPAHLVPTDYTCLPTLPRTLNGKTDRAALAQLGGLAAAPAAEPAATPVGGAPRTETERLVARIWQDCLGSTAPVRVTDDFFAIGGHSLVAVRVMTQLERATGKRLPLASLFECPTIEKLAALLDEAGEAAGFNLLVSIKPTGSRPPLYIVHGAGLNVLLFNTLPRHMAADQPVYGLQAKGLDGVEAPLTTIEEMAQHYVEAIVAHNPTGPYALAGYSYGGIIAYEMSRQLLAAGRQISFLGMLDTYAYQTAQNQPRLVRAWHHHVFQVKNLLFKASLLLRRPSLVLRYYNPTLLRKLLAQVRYSKTQRQAHYEELNGHSHALGEAYEAAQQAYQLTSQPLHLHVFRSTERVYYVEDATYLGWREFAQLGVTMHAIPGNHFSLFDAPHAQACAQALQQALDASLRP